MSTRSSQTPSPLAGRHILLCVTGGIAAYKSCILTRLFTSVGATVQVVMTDAATRFVGPETFAALSGRPVLTTLWGATGTVPHVRAAHEADLVVVAPATANTLAKMALGFSDDVVSATLLEATAPIMVAPAMHTGMYRDQATQDNLRMLAERGVRIVGPVDGKLAAGDEGPGRMVEPETLLEEAEALIGRGQDLSGVRILLTAGPTWEPIDAVRFIGNRSTGRMGSALATEAHRRGAQVTMILGPGTEQPPSEVDIERVTTAEEMLAAVDAAFANTDVLIMAAAVADYRSDAVAEGKRKKRDGIPQVTLVENPDILATMGERKQDHQIVVGFAAETQDFLAAGRQKLTDKGSDLIVVNEVGREGTGFGSSTDRAMIVRASDAEPTMELWTKEALAREILDVVVKLRAER